MDRLTKVKSWPDGAKIYDISNELFKANCSRADKTRMILEKLAEYEDLEESGNLLRSPCRLGDTVYILNQKRIIPLEICEIYFDSHGIEMAAKNREELRYRTINLSEDGIGVEWYKTEEEAEAAMNKVKGKNNKDIERT
jgi:hypothetical protein